MARIKVSTARINDRNLFTFIFVFKSKTAVWTGVFIFNKLFSTTRAEMNSSLCVALFTFQRKSFEQCLDFFPFSPCYVIKFLLFPIFILDNESPSFQSDCMTISIENLSYRVSVRIIHFYRDMKNTFVGKYKEGTFQIKHNPACQ